MSNYATKLKTWGATGSEYPDGYSYLEGDQPVDAWDNYIMNNIINDIKHLTSLTNDRLESDRTSSHPSTPETGHMSYRTDTASLPKGKETLYQYDNTNGVWERLMKASGDKMTGQLDMGGYAITDSSGELALASALDVAANDITDGTTTIWDTTNGYIPSSVVQSSGLDADTLDGNDSTAYASSTHSHGHSELTGINAAQHHPVGVIPDANSSQYPSASDAYNSSQASVNHGSTHSIDTWADTGLNLNYNCSGDACLKWTWRHKNTNNNSATRYRLRNETSGYIIGPSGQFTNTSWQYDTLYQNVADRTDSGAWAVEIYSGGDFAGTEYVDENEIWFGMLDTEVQ